MFGGAGAAAKVAEETAAVAKVQEILSITKGSRPDPATYLPQSYIDSHLAQFDNGVTKISAGIRQDGVIGSPEGTFVMPTSVANKIIEQAGGSVSKLEDFLVLILEIWAPIPSE